MHHLLKLVSTVIFFLSLLNAETSLNCNIEPQNNPINSLWACPDINDKTNATLSDVNLVSGSYVCTYYYKKTGRMATSCQHTSQTYISQSKNQFKKVDSKSTKYESVEFNTDANIFSEDYSSTAIKNLQKLTNKVIKELNSFSKKAMGYKDGGISAEDTVIKKMQQTIYDHLKKPYVSNEEGLVKKGDTFSRFLAGMVTLDPEVVKGYDEYTGKLMTTSDWNNKASRVSDSEERLRKEIQNYLPWRDYNPLIGLGDIMGKSGQKGNTLDTDTYNVVKWVDVFSMKIWGYYYNYQRNLDIGYDKLSMSLLFMFLIFFASGLALKSGTSFALGKEQGFKLSEKGTLKVLSVMGAFVIFFISIPSTRSSHNTVTKDSEVIHEMKTNGSLIKTYIRYVAKEGSYYGDMFSDLATSSFLDYVIKKQGLYTGNEIRSLFNSNVRQMVYYYPSLQLAIACENYYGLPFNKFISSPDMTQYSVHPNNTSPFFEDNKINAIDFSLCANMHKNLIMIPGAIASEAVKTLAKMNNVMKVRSTATRYLIQNHVLLQDKLGWINIISIPYTYNMMKHQDLFFESDLDYEEIDKETKQYISNIGLKDKGDIVMNNLGFVDWMDTGTGKIRDNTAQVSAFATHFISKYAYYNFLPGFSGIKNNVQNQLKVDKKSAILKKVKNLKAKIPMLKFLPIEGAMEGIVLWLSYFLAMKIWSEAIVVTMLVLIAIMFTVKIIIYLFDLIIHFVVSPFMILWAFKGGSNVGVHKLKHFAKNTLLIGFTPVFIVFSAGLYIFLNGTFEQLSILITNGLVEQQMNMVNLAITEAETLSQDAFTAYLTLYSIMDLLGILMLLMSPLIAYYVLFKLEPNIKKQLGIDDSAISSNEQTFDESNRQGEKNVNPLTK